MFWSFLPIFPFVKSFLGVPTHSPLFMFFPPAVTKAGLYYPFTFLFQRPLRKFFPKGSLTSHVSVAYVPTFSSHSYLQYTAGKVPSPSYNFCPYRCLIRENPPVIYYKQTILASCLLFPPALELVSPDRVLFFPYT